MLDVLHYYFEEDFKFTTGEESDRKSMMRESLYQNLYGQDYLYSSHKSPTAQNTYESVAEQYGLEDDDDGLSEVKVFNPKSAPAAPYVPPTKFDPSSSQPFGNILDSPLG
jgi:hypothetical protein